MINSIRHTQFNFSQLTFVPVYDSVALSLRLRRLIYFFKIDQLPGFGYTLPELLLFNSNCVLCAIHLLTRRKKQQSSQLYLNNKRAHFKWNELKIEWLPDLLLLLVASHVFMPVLHMGCGSHSHAKSVTIETLANAIIPLKTLNWTNRWCPADLLFHERRFD